MAHEIVQLKAGRYRKVTQVTFTTYVMDDNTMRMMISYNKYQILDVPWYIFSCYEYVS